MKPNTVIEEERSYFGFMRQDHTFKIALLILSVDLGMSLSTICRKGKKHVNLQFLKGTKVKTSKAGDAQVWFCFKGASGIQTKSKDCF